MRTLASAMPLLEHNIATNLPLFPNAPPKAYVLDWDDKDLPDFIQDFTDGFNAIMYVE